MTTFSVYSPWRGHQTWDYTSALTPHQPGGILPDDRENGLEKGGTCMAEEVMAKQ
jgi:hypothetical protein